MAYMSEGEAYRGIWKVIRHNLYYNDLVNIIELSKAMSDSLGEITGDLGEFALRHRERLHLAEYQALRMRHFEEYRQAQEELDAFMGRVPAIEASFRLASRAYLGHIGEAFTQIDILERYGGEIFSSNTIATSAPLAQSKLGRLRLPDFDVMIGGERMWIEAKAKARPDYSRSKGGEFGLSVAQLNDYIRVEELTGAPVQISLFDLSSLSVYGIPLRDWILAGREGGGFTWVPVNIFKHPFDVSFARDHVFLDFILHMIELALLDTNKTLDFPRLDELLDWYEEQP